MNRETLTKLRQLLVTLYDDPQTIRLVAEDAGLNIARINMGGSAVNIWHAVLNEAQKVDAIGKLVTVVAVEYRKPAEAMASLLGISLPPEEESSPTPSTAQENGGASTDETRKPLTTATIQPRPPTPILPIEHNRALRLHQEEQALLSTLFNRATRLRVLTEFTDGRTATRVFLIRPTDRDGVEELPAVVKIGPRALIEPEWQATQHHVLRRLPGFIPIQGEPIYLASTGGEVVGALRYGQVGDGVFTVESLATYFASSPLVDSWHVLDRRLLLQLGQLWRSTISWKSLVVQNAYEGILPVNLTLEPLAAGEMAAPTSIRLDGQGIAGGTDPLPVLHQGDLVTLENFVITEMDARQVTLDLPNQPNAQRTAYRLRLQLPSDAVGQIGTTLPPTVARVKATRQDLLREGLQSQMHGSLDLTQAELALPDNPSLRLPNPLLVLPQLLSRSHNAKFSTIHGDLNLRNILVDVDARSTHIIDCAAARQDHAIQDLLRMERDFLTDVLVQIFFQAGLSPTTIVRLYQLVHCASRGAPAASGHFSLPSELPPTLHKAFVILVSLRRAARDLLAEPGQWSEYYTGLIIHLVGALKFRDLDNATAGHQPKVLAFWGAATILHLLHEVEAGQDRTCRGIDWRFFDVMSDGRNGAPTDEWTKGVSLPNSAETLGFDLPEEAGPANGEEGGLESYNPGATTPSAAAEQPPIQRRLDVAAPEMATLGRAFSLAVAVRQLASPTLNIAELPAVRSGQALLDWPDAERFVRLRVEIIAPECEIVGAASYTFKLYRDLDSELYHFSLIPKATGQLSIIVRLYQEEDMLGSALAYTTVGEAVVSEVPVQLRSEPVRMKEIPAPAGRHAIAPTTPSAAGHPIKILFLAANPLDTVRLRTDEEARAIDLALRQAENRNFVVSVHGAVRTDDLQELLLRHQPDIVHFSGHGADEQSLILEGPNGNGVRVSGTALRQLFGVLKGNIRCIVLNACYSAEQAKGLAEVIDCVVGIEDAISDEAARQFSTAFYRGLGYERSIGEAFALGQVQIELAGLGEGGALHLLTREDGAAATKFGDVSNIVPAERGQAGTSSPKPVQRTSTPAVDTEFLQSMLTQHRRNLQLLQRQKANFGAGEEPLRLLNQIAAEEEEIARIAGELGG